MTDLSSGWSPTRPALRLAICWAGSALLGDGAARAEETPPAPPPTVGRAAENAVTEADDAFGISIGREAIGIYTSGSVRGFSPTAAGNIRIEGLYFDQFLGLVPRVRRSTTIRVGLSAQGFPFPSPTGIVDYSLRKPGDKPSLSTLVSIDGYGAASAEFDAVVPLDDDRLSVGFGVFAAHNEFYNGTDSTQHNQGVILRWQPDPDIELLPFWTHSVVKGDEQGPLYVPAGPYLPPPVPRRRFDGPEWADYGGVATTHGLVASARPHRDWLVRLGLFRSLFDDHSAFSHLLLGLQPDSRADRLIIADPPSRFVSVSGELRVSRTLAEGSRFHVLHLSARGRDRRQRYGGSAAIDYGPTRIGEPFDVPEPDFAFGEQTRDRVRQGTFGVAYEGRWTRVGELSFGLSKTGYAKRVSLPAMPPRETRAHPWIYNATAAAHVTDRLALYAGYSRGLEESGVAPSNAVNRNEPLPAILTSQRDAGLRYALTDRLKVIAGLFDLRKPYFNLDAAGRFAELGDVKNRGLEVSLSGAITPRLDIVAGAVLLYPEVTGEGVTLGRVGPRPVGLARRTADVNADWRVSGLNGVSLDLAVSHRSRLTATRDNLVSLPARTLIDLGGRYRFRIAERSAMLRVQVANLTDERGFELRGAGAYDSYPGRLASAYLTIDF